MITTSPWRSAIVLDAPAFTLGREGGLRPVTSDLGKQARFGNVCEVPVIAQGN